LKNNTVFLNDIPYFYASPMKKVVSIVTVGLMFLSCDLTNQEDEESDGSILGSWEQIEKRATISAGWLPLGNSFYMVTFESNGTHTIQQGNFANSRNCTGTWLASGNALTLTNNCGQYGESKENLHYSLSDTIMTWTYDFSETGKRFKKADLEPSF
tara:strand:+ start:1607 stop:2074 length:468 start_codon:yes stop_codon:yes gene_type:complete